uniref:Large polyvalent protein associated domain-containing protein n=1 Tax=viral metagenome TaxID=1070528 RepID=A0A6H1ZBK5_9ZZZZ
MGRRILTTEELFRDKKVFTTEELFGPPTQRDFIDSTIDEVVNFGWPKDEDFRSLLKETAAHEAHYGELDSKNPMRVDDITYRNFEQEPKILPLLKALGAKVEKGKIDREDLKTNIVVGAMKYNWKDKISEGSRQFKASPVQEERAAQWKEIYNTIEGKGTSEKFLKSLEKFNMREKPYSSLFDFLIPSAEAAETTKPKIFTTEELFGEKPPEKKIFTTEELFGDKKEKSLISDIYNGVQSGLSSTWANVARTPAAMYDLAAIPQNFLVKALGKPELQVKSPEWMMNNPIAKTYDFYANQFEKQITPTKSLEEAFKTKDFSNVGRHLAIQVAKNAPQQLSIIASYLAGYPRIGLAGMGMLQTTQALQQTRDKDPAMAAYNALSQGVIEAGFESIGTMGILNKWSNVLRKSFGTKTAKQIIGDVFKTVFHSAIGEGNEEWWTSLAQDFSSVATGIDKDALQGSLPRALESAAVGAISGTLMTAPTTVGTGIKSAEYKKLSDIEQRQPENILGALKVEPKPTEVPKAAPVTPEALGEAIPPELEPLDVEARKYKSAEDILQKGGIPNPQKSIDWIKNIIEKNADEKTIRKAIDILSSEKSNPMTRRAFEFIIGKKLPITQIESKTVLEQIAGLQSDKQWLTVGEVKKAVGELEGKMAFLDRTGRSWKAGFKSYMTKETPVKIIGIDGNYVAYKYVGDTAEHLAHIDDIRDIKIGGKSILEETINKTKSQLTDIWNKAQEVKPAKKPEEGQALIEEAKKYKSAEEATMWQNIELNDAVRKLKAARKRLRRALRQESGEEQGKANDAILEAEVNLRNAAEQSGMSYEKYDKLVEETKITHTEELADIWKKAQGEDKFQQLMALSRKPLQLVEKIEEIKKTTGEEREKWMVVLKRFEEATRPEEKIKIEKPVKKKNLIPLVKSLGGINLSKAKSAGFTYQSFKEYGLLSVLKKEGRGIDDIASELVSMGELIVSEGQNPSDALMEALQERISPISEVGRGAGGAMIAAAGVVGKGGYGTIEPSEKFVQKREKGKIAKTDYSKIAEEMPVEKFSVMDEVLKLVSPATRKGALIGKKILRKNISELAHKDAVAIETLQKSHAAFKWMNKEDTLDFIDRMEEGREQKVSKLQGISKIFRELLDGRRTDIQNLGKGHLETFIENYFPHIWKDPKKAKDVISSIMGKKWLEGTKSFLKKRVIVSVKDGVNRGLELVSDNPVDLVLLKLHEMDRYIMAQNIIRDLRERNLIKFVYSRGGKKPDGYIKVNDNAFTVYMPPEITKKDAYDSIMVDQLMDVAQSLGIDTKRFVSIGGKRLGFIKWSPLYPGEEQVRTRFTSPESVLAHEIGHVLGIRYKLYDLLGRRNDGEWKVHEKGKNIGVRYFAPSKDAVEYRRIIDEQWRALADARYKSLKVAKGFQQYVRKAREKEAVMLEAMIHAPEEFNRVAPDLYKVFKAFLNNHSELRPILDIRPSLVLGENEAKIPVPGFTTLGHYYSPEPVATLINNYLSPGLRNNNNKLIAGGYNLLRGAGNVLNQAQLAFSLFHGLNVTTDMIASTSGLGWRKLQVRGQRIKGLTDIATSLIAPITVIWNGARIRKAYTQQLDSITNPKMRQMVEAIIAAGGRDRMDVFYYNNQIKALEKTFSDIAKGDAFTKIKSSLKLPFNLFGATLEVAAKPLMEWYVPTGKIGLFAKLAQHEMERAEAGQINEDQLWEQLTQVWDSVDNRMGQLVYDNLFWEKTTKDTLMLSTRSVGWNLGSWREYGGAAVDLVTTQERIKRGDIWFSHKMSYTIGAVTLYSILGAVITYILTGKPPEEPKDYLFPKTGKKNPDGSDERLSLPTYAKDWYAWSHRPLETIIHKIHPLWGLLGDLATNEDYFNVEVRHTDDPLLNQAVQLAKHIGNSFKPISLRNYEKMERVTPKDKRNIWISITGITSAPSYITRSPAQKLMTRIIVERIPPKTKTKEEFEKSAYRKTLKNRIRKGERIDHKEAKQMLGQVSYNRLIKEAKMPPFADSFKRLGIKDALNVYAIATEEERKQVIKILKDKYNRAESNTKTEEIKSFYHHLLYK